MSAFEEICQRLRQNASAETGELTEPEREGPYAAVAAILREGAFGPEVLFIVRAESPRDPWSGHVAFPGGRYQGEDASLVATAIRETREEVGIDLHSSGLLTRLPDVPAVLRVARGRLVVRPFVFATREVVTPIMNHEVSATLWVPLTKLASAEARSTYAFTWKEESHEVPCVRLESESGEHVLWGMTHRMVETLLEALTP